MQYKYTPYSIFNLYSSLLFGTHRKKASYRLIENLSRDQKIQSKQFRMGKNSFVKYWWDNNKVEEYINSNDKHDMNKNAKPESMSSI